MAGEWRDATLGEIVDFVSGSTPSTGNASYWNGSIPWVSAKDMRRLFLDDSEDHLTESGVTNASKLIPPNTVLLLTRGMTLLNDVPICVTRRHMTFNQDIKALRPKGEVAEAFLPYLLLGHKHRLLRLVDLAGHGTGRLNTDELKTFDVRIPPLREQHGIAHILGTLDDKIELNRRMGETLESIVRALFKSWFVDFDPVRAKAEGRDPGLPKSLADLFPARLVDSELGKIPEGWSAKPLGRWVDALSGATPSKSTRDYWDGAVPWISPKVMTGIHADQADEHVSELAIKNGTRIAPALSTLVMVRGMGLHEFVRVSQARRDVAFNQDVKALVGTSIDATLLLFALLDAQPTLLERVESSGHGTGKLPSEVLFALPITMPDPTTQLRLASPLRVLNDRIASSRAESRTLSELRESLLPKLTTGELRVPGSAASTALA